MGVFQSAIQCLEEFIAHNHQALNSPGIAIGITDRESLLHMGAFGYANLDAQTPVHPDTLFEIGSISKAFTSIVLLRLQSLGLLDIYKPVIHYLPWFSVQSSYPPITLHHLMSHTAGIVMGLDATVSAYTETWNLRETEVGAPPGTYFHYSNGGYKILGLILQRLLGQSTCEILREQVLHPVGMHASLGAITNADRENLAVGYEPYHDDRPLPFAGRLAPAAWLETDLMDGSICSTAVDMCAYLRMLLNRGGDLLSEKEYEQLIQPVIATGDDLHGEGYAYGLVVEHNDRNLLIGHSGGMVGYTASVLADLDDGFGVAVLTNGHGDTETIALYALRLFQAAHTGDNPQTVTLPDLYRVERASSYVGDYSSGDRVISIIAPEKRLWLEIDGEVVPLEPHGKKGFLANHPDYDKFLFYFRSKNGKIVDVCHGSDCFSRLGINAAEVLPCPPSWRPYPGHYRAYNPWFSNFRIVSRKGNLIHISPSGSEEPLCPLDSNLFRVGEDPRSPERLRFELIIDGQAQQANFSGGAYSRTFTS